MTPLFKTFPILFFLTINPAHLFAQSQTVAPSLQVYDRNGLSMGTLLSPSETYSDPVSLEAISPWMLLATIATEDKRFYLHPGVDLEAALRALWQDVSRRKVVSGASTLTEQLVKALEPAPKSLWGKMKEAWGALLLERKMTKREILESYFNTISYGNQCQGVEAASRRYFGVHAPNLSLAQAAYLSGIPKSPVRYDPYRNPDQAGKRQKDILSTLQAKGWVDAENIRLALEEPLRLKKPDTSKVAPHFLMFLNARYQGKKESLVTTLDLNLQRDLQNLLATQLRRLKGNHVTNGAILVVDVQNSQVLAWVGSADFWNANIQGQVDGVEASRQPGSSLKPFLYGLAFSKGYKPSDLLLDEPTYTAGRFIPKNYDEKYHGWVRMRTALANSYNVPAIRLCEKVGASKFLDFLHQCGFQSLVMPAEHYGLGLALGDGEITMLESASAYAALARGGLWRPLKCLQNEDVDPLDGGESAHRILNPEDAFLVTSILSDNTARSPAFGLYSPLLTPFPFAAKTGTTKDYRDNWAVGYTPNWVVAVWVGNFDGTPMRHISGITGAAPLLHDTAMMLSNRFPPRPFVKPKGVVEMDICSLTGLKPSPYCESQMREVFDTRYLPASICALHSAPVTEKTALSKGERAVLFPREGDIFKIDPSAALGSQAIRLQATQKISPYEFWEVDGKKIDLENGEAWWSLIPGKHQVALVEENAKGKKIVQRIRFLVVP